MRTNSLEQENLYTALVAAGIPTANHESDLYFPITPETKEILERFPLQKQCTTTFRNNIDGKMWFDTAFAFVPWWEARSAK